MIRVCALTWQRVAGVVVEPGDDLGVRAGLAVGSGEPVVGEVGLPALIGLVGFKSKIGRLRPRLRLRNDQAESAQVTGDGRRRHHLLMMVVQMPRDGVRSGV
ncbi:MAG: hypothetical protein WKF82_10070 [Nocardioidaceae bacterium]